MADLRHARVGRHDVLLRRRAGLPRPDRLWAMVERHRITILGVSPTLVRALMAKGDEHVRPRTTSRRCACSRRPASRGTKVRGAGTSSGSAASRCSVINVSGGTEVGCFLAPHVVEEISPCSLGGPALGCDVDVVDDDCNPVRGVVGELVCRQPWPAMTRGVWKDPERYLETYWSRWPGVWWHGDWASIDDVGPVVPARPLGRHDQAGGQAARSGRGGDRAGRAPGGRRSGGGRAAGRAEGRVARLLRGARRRTSSRPRSCGPSCGPTWPTGSASRSRPRRCGSPTALPKTRSNKIMRRSIRAVALGQDRRATSPGLEDPGALDAIAQAR